MHSLIISFILVFLIVLLFKAGRFVWNYINERAYFAKREAYSLYVETGQEGAGFHRLNHRDVKAAQRERKRRVKNLAKQNNQFSAITDCPNCNAIATHYVHKSYFSHLGCIRQCRECEYVWRQK